MLKERKFKSVEEVADYIKRLEEENMRLIKELDAAVFNTDTDTDAEVLEALAESANEIEALKEEIERKDAVINAVCDILAPGVDYLAIAEWITRE